MKRPRTLCQDRSLVQPRRRWRLFEDGTPVLFVSAGPQRSASRMGVAWAWSPCPRPSIYGCGVPAAERSLGVNFCLSLALALLFCPSLSVALLALAPASEFVWVCFPHASCLSFRHSTVSLAPAGAG